MIPWPALVDSSATSEVPALEEAAHGSKPVSAEPGRSGLRVIKLDHPVEKHKAIPNHGGRKYGVSNLFLEQPLLAPVVLTKKSPEVHDTNESLDF